MNKKLLPIVLLLVIIAFSIHAQSSRETNLMVFNAAEDSYVSHFTEDNKWWKYIYDIPISFFDNGFIVIRKTKTDDVQHEYSVIKKDKYGVFICGIENRWREASLSGDKEYIFCPGLERRKELFGASESFLVEHSSRSVYCRSFSYDKYDDCISERSLSRQYLYVEYDSIGRASSFSFDGFTKDDIITSNRSIRPANPWKASYGNDGKVTELNKQDVVIQFNWSGDTLRYQRMLTRSVSPHYDLYALIVSNPDDAGRWTQEIIYDYDVIENAYLPMYSIERQFVAEEDYRLYLRAGFDEERVREMKSYEPEDDIYEVKFVEEKPCFQGGDSNAFSKWVNSRLVYPEIAKENGVQGKVTLQFTINTDGSVSDVKVLRGVDPSLDKEAVRVVSSSPKWTPGKQRDKPVAVTYTFPVIFQLK